MGRNNTKQDLTGRVFGKLTVLSAVPKYGVGHTRWNCQCECGGFSTPSGTHLISGHTTSCGCGKIGGKTEDLSGRVFGALTVVGFAFKDKSGVYRWLCRCECGGEITPRRGSLTSGHTTSCGCTDWAKVDLSGRVFGRLTVRCREGKGRARWRCDCVCGGSTLTTKSRLMGGTCKSCGCLARELSSERGRRYETPEEGNRRALYKNYQSAASTKGLEWGLSFEQFVGITTSDCTYCGKPPELRPGAGKNRAVHSSGIDRVDNSMGYVVSNATPCCTWCNRTKKAASAAFFIERCRAVVAKAGML